jgi:transposase InsO family protein
LRNRSSRRLLVALATSYGRYGYRRIAALLRAAGWAVNVKRVERIWRREGLKAPQKQPKKGRLWLNDGSCVRPRPKYVWSYDFVEGSRNRPRVKGI